MAWLGLCAIGRFATGRFATCLAAAGLFALGIGAAAAQGPTGAPASLGASPVQQRPTTEGVPLRPGLPQPDAKALQNTVPDTMVDIRRVDTPANALVTSDPALMAAIAGLKKDCPTRAPCTSLREIEDVRLQIVRKYREQQYPLVSVQASLQQGGVLQFQVFEGHIVDVKLDGDDIGPAATQVLRFLRHLTEPENQPVTVPIMERWLLLAQDIPGISLQAVLRAFKPDTDPGSLTLIATVRRTMVSGQYGVDNRGYNLTGPEQGSLTINLNSLTSLGERTELTLFHTFNDTQLFGQIANEFYVGGSGLKVRVYAGRGKVTPSGFLKDEGYVGDTSVMGVQAIYPLIRAREQTLNIVAGFDSIDSLITTAAAGTPRANASKDSLRIARVGVDYARRDLLLLQQSAINSVSVRVSHSFDGLGATHGTGPNRTQTPARVGEQIEFTKVSGEISRNQTLYTWASGQSVSLLGMLAGQGSSAVLPPAEKFFLGGPRFTRGFYSGEVSGDSALAATVELQWNRAFDFTLAGKPIDMTAQFYAFYDYGYAWQNQASDADKLVDSVGLGARLQLPYAVELDLEAVRRLTRNVDGANASQLKDYGLYWRVLKRF